MLDRDIHWSIASIGHFHSFVYLNMVKFIKQSAVFFCIHHKVYVHWVTFHDCQCFNIESCLRMRLMKSVFNKQNFCNSPTKNGFEWTKNSDFVHFIGAAYQREIPCGCKCDSIFLNHYNSFVITSGITAKNQIELHADNVFARIHPLLCLFCQRMRERDSPIKIPISSFSTQSVPYSMNIIHRKIFLNTWSTSMHNWFACQILI